MYSTKGNFLKSTARFHEQLGASVLGWELRMETFGTYASLSDDILVLFIQINEKAREEWAFTEDQWGVIRSHGLILPMKDIVTGQEHPPELQAILNKAVEKSLLDKVRVAVFGPNSFPTGKSSVFLFVPFPHLSNPCITFFFYRISS